MWRYVVVLIIVARIFQKLVVSAQNYGFGASVAAFNYTF